MLFIQKKHTSLFLFVLSFFLVTAMFFYVANNNFNNEIINEFQAVDSSINLILSHVEVASDLTSKYIGNDCNLIKDKLVDISSIYPYVRSVNIVVNGVDYCYSVAESNVSSIDYTQYTDGVFRLMKSDTLTPNAPVLIYKKDYQGGSILIGINVIFFEQVIRDNKGRISIFFGDDALSYNGYFPRRKIIYNNIYKRKGLELVAQVNFSDKFYFFTSKYLTYYLLFIIVLIVNYSYLHYGLKKITPLIEIKQGIKSSEFKPYIQPIVDNNKRIIGGEILVRWHRGNSIIMPVDFIHLVENSELIIPMTKYLMSAVHSELEKQPQELITDMYLSFNVCKKNFNNISILECCHNFKCGLPHNLKLVLEITERELIEDNKITRDIVSQLKKMGVSLILDDFGTGNSSLSYIDLFNINGLKIDKVFVDRINNNAINNNIIEAVCELSKRLNIDVIAEGIESKDQYIYLLKQGISRFQGYYFHKPLDIDSFFKLLKKQTTHSNN